MKACHLILLGCVTALGVPSWADNISFKQRFDAAAGQDVVVIALTPEDVLVMEPGNHFTNGRRLSLSAKVARVEGSVTVGFYAPDNIPATIAGVANTGPAVTSGANFNCGRSGCQGVQGSTGGTGATGTKGQPAPLMVIDIEGMEGAGTLTLLTAGQIGGKGQTGGQGGTGARGGDGAKRSCGGALGLDTRAGPGNGGPGNIGGQGGTGGLGGQGGDGGAVVIHQLLALPW